jgi:hypothetical protein
MAQIIRITSEALQATIRRLLPSQQGFGEDLQASNVITPIIDLTPTAEGSQLATDLARALSFGSQTAFNANNNTVTLANVPGFYRVFACATTLPNRGARLQLGNGFSTKVVWGIEGTTGATSLSSNVDITVFLDTGETLTATTSDVGSFLRGSVRQTADRYGNIVNPSGFTFE